jgi:hypothetical protein
MAVEVISVALEQQSDLRSSIHWKLEDLHGPDKYTTIWQKI